MFSHFFVRSAIFDLTQNLGDCGGDGLPTADFVGHFHHGIGVALTGSRRGKITAQLTAAPGTTGPVTPRSRRMEPDGAAGTQDNSRAR